MTEPARPTKPPESRTGPPGSAAGSSLRSLFHESVRPALPWLVWAAILAGVTLALGRSPLFRVASYELGFVVAVLVSVAGLHLAPLTYRRYREGHPHPHTAAGLLAASVGLVWRALWPVLLLAFEAADLAWASGADLGCQTWKDATFFALTAGGAAVVSTLVGLSLAMVFARPVAAVAAGQSLLLATWAFGVWRFYATPPVCVYDPFVGYFSGNLYDELLVLHRGLVWSRLQDLVLAGGVFLLAVLAGRRSVLRALVPVGACRRLLLLPAVFLAAALGLHLAHGRLGFSLTRQDLLRILSGRVETEHFLVAYDPRHTDQVAAALLAEDAEFRYSQLRDFFGVEPDRRVVIFVFSSSRQKKVLFGAHQVEMAKPWRREVYVTKAKFPHPVLKHELAHVFAASFGDPVFGVAFRWYPWKGVLPIPMFSPGLIEGAAVAADWRPADLTPHQRAKALVELGWEVAAESVMTYSFFGSAAVRSYSVAGSFCRFLIERYGIERFRRLYRSGGDFEAVYGKSLPDLAAEWRAFLTTVPLSQRQLDRARALLRARSVFGKRCVHKVADLLSRAAELPPDRALELYEQVCATDPGSDDGLWGLFETYLALEDLPRAVSAAALVARHPATSRAGRSVLLLELGDAYWKSGDTRLAERFFRASDALADSPYTHRAAAVRLSALRFPDTAEAVRLLLLEGRKEALAKLNLAIRRHPLWGVGYYLLGSWFLKQGQPGPAADFLLKSLRSPLPNKWIRWEAAMRLGRAWYLSGRFDRAVRLFRRLAQVAPARIARLASDWTARCQWAQGPGWKVIDRLR